MSFPPGVKFDWLQPLVYQAFVNGSMYARSGCTGRCAPPGVSGLPHASAVLALLPLVVAVGWFACTSKSHGAREAMFLTATWQLASAGLRLLSESSQQSTNRVSLLE